LPDPFVYGELRRFARAQLRRDPAGRSLQPTALVHEAYLRLVKADVDWRDRTHFLSVAARVMRRILVERARAGRARKRGGDDLRITLAGPIPAPEARPIDLLALDEAMDRLWGFDGRQARAVELCHVGGLTYPEGKALAHVGRCQEALAEEARAEEILGAREHETAGSWIAFAYGKCDRQDRAREYHRRMEELEQRRFVSAGHGRRPRRAGRRGTAPRAPGAGLPSALADAVLRQRLPGRPRDRVPRCQPQAQELCRRVLPKGAETLGPERSARRDDRW